MPAPLTSDIIDRSRARLNILQEELLYWVTEIGRAEEGGVATETQVQAIQSAAQLARREVANLRAVLQTDIEVADAEAEAIVKLNAELGEVVFEYTSLQDRAAKLFKSEDLTDPPLPTRYEPR